MTGAFGRGGGNRTAVTGREIDDLVRDLSEMIEVDLLTVLKKVAFDLLARIIKKTPVDTGRAQNNWVVGIGKMNTAVIPGTRITAERTIKKGQVKINSLTVLKKIVISNSVPYISYLEHGHSKQAPNGMLAISAAESKNELLDLTR